MLAREFTVTWAVCAGIDVGAHLPRLLVLKRIRYHTRLRIPPSPFRTSLVELKHKVFPRRLAKTSLGRAHISCHNAVAEQLLVRHLLDMGTDCFNVRRVFDAVHGAALGRCFPHVPRLVPGLRLSPAYPLSVISFSRRHTAAQDVDREHENLRIPANLCRGTWPSPRSRK